MAPVGGATFGRMGGGAAAWGGIKPENGDCVPLTEVMRLGEPGPETRGPKTPGREKAEDEVGGIEAEDPIARLEEN